MTRLLWLALLMLPALPASSQLPRIDEEDLDAALAQPVIGQGLEAVDTGLDDAALEALFTEAEAVFQSADQPASLTLFGQIVEVLEVRLANESLTEESRDLLLASLSYRAQAYFNFGEDELVDSSLRRMLEIDPGADLARDLVSPKLVQQFDGLRNRITGEIVFSIDPPDATAVIDGRKVELSFDASIRAPAGSRTLEIARPGYEPALRVVDVAAGRSTSLELALERSSPVLRLSTRPSDCEVLIDDVVLASTVASTIDTVTGDSSAPILPPSYLREEFSDELVLEGLELGLHVLEVRKSGYRSYRVELILDELIDYPMPPIVLEEQRGTLVLKGMPSGADLTINKETILPDPGGATTRRLTLPPGTYEISVSERASRMFSTSLTLADRQTIDVNVRLRPGLAFLGVVGGDPQEVQNVEQAFRAVLAGRGAAGSTKWTLIDRARPGPEVLVRAGATVEALRASIDDPSAVDWSAVQAVVDEHAPGLVYLLAVLATDLVATEAQVFIWASAPGPARPDVIAVPLENSSALVDLRSTFESGFPIFRPWLGAVLLDSTAGVGPRIAYLSPGGPAEQAGLGLGDRVYSVTGTRVSSAREIEARVAAAESGELVQVEAVAVDGKAKTVDLLLGKSPRILPHLETGTLAAVGFSELVLMEESSDPTTTWIVQLNQARILMRSQQWEQAVRRLHDISPPAAEVGVGQAAIDYWLGLALSKLGVRYEEAAKAALERAASQPHARLEHNDGPFVAPRARARLYAIGGR